MDSLACQARRLRQEPCLLQNLGWAWMSVFYFGARDYFQGTGSEPNPFLGAAGELGPSSVVTKVSGGELWRGPNVLHKSFTQQSGMRLYQRSG